LLLYFLFLLFKSTKFIKPNQINNQSFRFYFSFFLNACIALVFFFKHLKKFRLARIIAGPISSVAQLQKLVIFTTIYQPPFPLLHQGSGVFSEAKVLEMQSQTHEQLRDKEIYLSRKYYFS